MINHAISARPAGSHGGELQVAGDDRRGLYVTMKAPLGDPEAPDVR